MNPEITSNQPTIPLLNRRGRKPRTQARQALVDAEKQFRSARQAQQRALAKVEAEDQASLAKKGRTVFIHLVEKLHLAERHLIVEPVIQQLSSDDHSAIVAWLSSLS